MKKIAISILITIVIGICVNSHSVIAAGPDNSVISLEYMDGAELTRVISGLVSGIASGSLGGYETYLEQDAYDKLSQYISSGKMLKPNAYDNIIDKIEVTDSSSGDCVVMVNSKFIYEDIKLLYLFEFHVNSSGKVYGLNIWSY